MFSKHSFLSIDREDWHPQIQILGKVSCNEKGNGRTLGTPLVPLPVPTSAPERDQLAVSTQRALCKEETLPDTEALARGHILAHIDIIRKKLRLNIS